MESSFGVFAVRHHAVARMETLSHSSSRGKFHLSGCHLLVTRPPNLLGLPLILNQYFLGLPLLRPMDSQPWIRWGSAEGEEAGSSKSRFYLFMLGNLFLSRTTHLQLPTCQSRPPGPLQLLFRLLQVIHDHLRCLRVCFRNWL